MKMGMKMNRQGFSLIELMIAVSVLAIMSSAFMLGIQSYRGRYTEKYIRELQNQIQLTQTIAMTKAGSWRLVLCRDAQNRYYCIRQSTGASGSSLQESDWKDFGSRVELGSSGAVTWQTVSSPTSEDETEQPAETAGCSTILWHWYFDSDTGACTTDAASLIITGAGRRYQLNVYPATGYCEVQRI